MNPGSSRPIGVFDSGVGGLTVLRALKEQLPGESFIYLGDTARVPYGSKPPELIERFSHEITTHLLQRQVKGIVVACNTAAAVCLPQLAAGSPVPVWGVIEPGVEAAAAAAGAGVVGVLGTRNTIASGAYQEGLRQRGFDSWGRACPLFVPIVEEGIADSAIAEQVAAHYLQDRPELDVVILGCTHYPVLRNTLQRVLGQGVKLVDSAQATARVVAADLEKLGLINGREAAGEVLHLVTGDIPGYIHAAGIIGAPAGEVHRVDLGNGRTPGSEDQVGYLEKQPT